MPRLLNYNLQDGKVSCLTLVWHIVVAEVDNNGAGWVSQAEGNPKVEAMGMQEVRAAP